MPGDVAMQCLRCGFLFVDTKGGRKRPCVGCHTGTVEPVNRPEVLAAYAVGGALAVYEIMKTEGAKYVR